MVPRMGSRRWYASAKMRHDTRRSTVSTQPLRAIRGGQHTRAATFQRGDVGVAVDVERAGGDDQDGGVDKEREQQSHDGVHGGVTDRGADGLDVVAVDVAGEDQGGVEEEVVGHDGRAHNAGGDEEFSGDGVQVGGGDEATHDGQAVRPRQPNLHKHSRW